MGEKNRKKNKIKMWFLKEEKNVLRKTKQKCGGWWFLRGNSIVALFSLWVNSILIKFARGPGFDSQLPPIFTIFCSYSSVG